MIIPRQDKTQPVSQYRFPHLTFPHEDAQNGMSEAGDASNFKINPVSGDITWDAPGTRGEYNIAFQVVEWRKVNGNYYKLGYVTRDMQILVEDETEGGLPALNYPFTSNYLSPAAGEAHSWTITASAPSREDSVVLELWGDFAERTNASISSSMVRAKGEASITIQWTGEEDRGQFYQLIARSYHPASPQLTRNRTTYFYYSESAEPLGIESSRIAALQLFPNPVTDGKFKIRLQKAPDAELLVQVFDLKGRQLINESKSLVTGKEISLELKDVSKGAYVLLLHQKGQIQRAKLIVQ
jgi:hypothetical protein